MSLPLMSAFLSALDRVLAHRNRRDARRAVHGPGASPACSDCRGRIPEGAHSTPEAIYCDPCWRWRQHRCAEFDPRSRAAIEAAERQGAA